MLIFMQLETEDLTLFTLNHLYSVGSCMIKYISIHLGRILLNHSVDLPHTLVGYMLLVFN